MGHKKNIEHLYKKFLDNTLSKKELKIFWEQLAKVNDDDVEPLKTALRNRLSADVLKATGDSERKNKLREKLQARMDNDMLGVSPARNPLDDIRPPKKAKRNTTFLKVAAVITLALVSSFALYFLRPQLDPVPATKTYRTAHRQKSKIILPDQSVVYLNSGSTLTYPEKFKGNAREVILEGEAFFEVTHHPKMPFTVNSGELSTTVLGTSFNIKAYPGDQDIQVAVATGKVSVSRKKNEQSAKEALALVPGEIASYNIPKGTLAKATGNVLDHIASWKDGTIVLDDKSFAEVGKILEKWYGMKIIFENPKIEKCLVRGKFHDNPSLQQVLEALQFVHNIQYEFKTDTVLISGKGCL